jgi:hypothetical protein
MDWCGKVTKSAPQITINTVFSNANDPYPD